MLRKFGAPELRPPREMSSLASEEAVLHKAPPGGPHTGGAQDSGKFKKNQENSENIQKAFNHRAKMNGLSSKGEWSEELEKEFAA